MTPYLTFSLSVRSDGAASYLTKRKIRSVGSHALPCRDGRLLRPTVLTNTTPPGLKLRQKFLQHQSARGPGKLPQASNTLQCFLVHYHPDTLLSGLAITGDLSEMPARPKQDFKSGTSKRIIKEP